MADLTVLRAKNPLPDVIEADGYALARKPGEAVWYGVEATGLAVEVEKGRYYWAERGEAGDVFDWLSARHGWQFKQALNFLTQRAALPEELRPKLCIPVIEQPAGDGQAPGRNGNGHHPGEAVSSEIPNRFIAEAVSLAVDYPGFEKMVNKPFFDVWKAAQFIPRRFMSLSGQWTGEICGLCFKDFGEGFLEIGELYLAVSTGWAYELIPDGTCAGLYCGSCVSQLRRWGRAFDLLLKVLNAERIGRDGD